MPVYRALTAVLAPLARRRLRRAAREYPELEGRDSERLGDVEAAPEALWIHAASVGELNAATPLIGRLLAEDPDRRILLSNLTATAASQATRRYAVNARVQPRLAPLDRPRAVRRWLDRTRPAALLLIETELWPVLLDECRQREIPVAIANARLSEKAFRGYRRVRGLFRRLLPSIATVACQSQEDADRFVALGARPDACVVTGNIKFDPEAPAALPPEIEAVTACWMRRPTWIAGSTHHGEEEVLAEAHRALRRTHADALLVLVPRHPERAGEAHRTLERAGLRASSLGNVIAGESVQADLDVLVVDRLGVLAGLYPHGDAVFVGGSLVDGIGGHNLIEAAGAGRPVLTGPFTADQRNAADGLEQAEALLRIHDAEATARAVAGLLEDPARGERLARNAAIFLQGQRGSLDRTVEVLENWLDRGKAPPSRG